MATKKPTGLVLIISNDKKHQDANISILKKMTKQHKLKGIHATLLSPHSLIVKKLQKEKVPLENVFFIDGVSTKCTDQIKKPHYQPIQGPEALTELSIVISEHANTGTYQFVLLDSLSVLRLYNTFENSSRFLRFISNKLKLLGITCVILSIRETEVDKLNAVIEQLAEKIIEL